MSVSQSRSGGAGRFFNLTLSHNTLVNYFKTNFGLMQHHKYSLTEIENMMPWERDIYVGLLIEWIKDEEQRIKQEQQQRG